MSSLKYVTSLPKLLERHCYRLINVSYNQRKFHLMNVGIKVKKMDLVTLKPSRDGIQHRPVKTVSIKPEQIREDNPSSEKRNKITSSEEIENLLATGDKAVLKGNAKQKIVRNGVVTVPEDMTEQEFIEVVSDTIRTKYAQTRLANLSPEEEKRLKILKLFYDVLDSTDSRVPTPEYMTDGRWLYLLLLKKTEDSIRRTLSHWFKIEKVIEGVKAKKVQTPERDLDHSGYVHNKLLRRITTTTMNVHYYNNLAFSMQFGQPLIFDFSFASEMTVRQLEKTLTQFKSSHGINKMLWEPFHVYVCGFPSEGKFYHLLREKIGDILRPDVPITFTTKDVHEIDSIPREKLVYLSPNSPHTLKQFSHDDVYVIGGIVDMGPELPLTYAKTKRLELRSAKLPLDRYVLFQGGKAMTLNHTTSILTDLKTGMSMRNAVLRGVPSRKIKEILQHDEEDFSFVEHKRKRRGKTLT